MPLDRKKKLGILAGGVQQLCGQLPLWEFSDCFRRGNLVRIYCELCEIVLKLISEAPTYIYLEHKSKLILIASYKQWFPF